MGVIAESEWRGGEQKKLEFCKVDMPTYIITILKMIFINNKIIHVCNNPS